MLWIFQAVDLKAQYVFIDIFLKIENVNNQENRNMVFAWVLWKPDSNIRSMCIFVYKVSETVY